MSGAAPSAVAGLAALSSSALGSFLAGESDAAANYLSELSAVDGTVDPRVVYNLAVLRFYSAHGCRDVAPLLAATLRLLPKQEADRLAPPAARVIDLLAAVATPETLEALRAIAGFVPLFNVAVVAYNGGHVIYAGKLAAYLFSHVEAMEDWLALRTCFLTMDVYLRSGDMHTAARVLVYLEKLVPSISGSAVQQAAQSEADDVLASDAGTRSPVPSKEETAGQRLQQQQAARQAGVPDQRVHPLQSKPLAHDAFPKQSDDRSNGREAAQQRKSQSQDSEQRTGALEQPLSDRQPECGDQDDTSQTGLLEREQGSRLGADIAAADTLQGSDQNSTSDASFVVERVTPPWRGADISVMASPVTVADVKVAVRMYAARLSAAQADVKQLRKEAKSAVMLSSEDGQCPTAAALMMKAKLDVNTTKALRVLACIHSQAPDRVRAAILPLLLNNLGVVHHRLGRHALAALYLQRSRECFSSLFGSRGNKDNGLAAVLEPQPVSIMARSADSHVTYNLGLQYIQLGFYREALEMFSLCARSDEVQAARSPMLWIRVAECCVAEANRGMGQKPLYKLLGCGTCRRYVLLTPPAMDESLMRYTALCARNAVAIMDGTPPSHSPLLSTDEAAAAAANRQRCSALALLAYASLEFDPAAAILACNELVSSSRPGSAELSVLGTLYGAEALCMLGCLDEAADRLAPLLTMGSARMSDARDGAFVNAAVAHSMRGDMAAATRAAKTALKVASSAAPDCITRKQAIMVAAYVSLREGNTDAARQLLQSAR